MKSRYRILCTIDDVQRAVKKECDAKIDEVYENVKKDVAAQLTAVFLIYLHQRYSWKGKVLNTVKAGVEDLFRVMETDGIFGKEFNPVNCIEYLKEMGVDIE